MESQKSYSLQEYYYYYHFLCAVYSVLLSSGKTNEPYHMAAKLSSLWVDAHDRGSCKDQFWVPWQKDKLHDHSPPCSNFIRSCL